MSLWPFPGTTPIFAHTPHFSLGQNSVTIKRVGHGWVRTYHIETRTIKECIPLWNKHTTIPLMRLVVCFDGRIIYTVTVSPPSSLIAHPVPHVLFSTFYAFHNLLLLSSGYLVILILFLSFSPAFCRPVAFARLPISPLPLLPLLAFPPFSLTTSTALVYKFPF